MKKGAKVRTGIVTSDRLHKTVVVTLDRQTTHPLYGKKVRRRKRIKVHDEQNVCRVGDVVRVEECRPLSRDKHWKLLERVRSEE